MLLKYQSDIPFISCGILICWLLRYISSVVLRSEVGTEIIYWIRWVSGMIS